MEGEQLDSIGLLYDFGHLKRILRDLIAGVDHKFLNDQAPFDSTNPSAENIAKFFYDHASQQMQNGGNNPRITSVTVWETDEASATYTP